MSSQSELLIARESTDISIHSICIYTKLARRKRPKFYEKIMIGLIKALQARL